MEGEDLRGKANRIFGVAIFLTIIGLLMIFSSSGIAIGQKGMYYLFGKQLGLAFLGFLSIFIIRMIKLEWWSKYSALFLVLSLGYLASTLFISTSSDAKRWSFLGQPSEFVKVSFSLYLSSFFSKKEGKEGSKFIAPCIILGIILGILIAQPHYGMAGFFCFLTISIFFLAGIKKRYLLSLIISLIIIMAVVIGKRGYSRERVGTFLSKYPIVYNLPCVKKFIGERLGDRWQVIQAGIALGSGGLVGKGLGASMQKLSYVPIPYSDFIFSIIGEELGFLLGSLLLFSLFGYFAYLGFSIACSSPSTMGFFLAFSLTFSIISQAIINIAVVSDFTLTTGLGLPFISYGGSFLLSSLISVGFIMNVAGQKIE